MLLQGRTTTTELLKSIRIKTMATPKIRMHQKNIDRKATGAMMVMASGMTTLKDTMMAMATTSGTSMLRKASTAHIKIQTSLAMVVTIIISLLQEAIPNPIRSKQFKDAAVFCLQ